MYGRAIALLLFAFHSLAAASSYHKHDSSFQPDYVLVATAENITVDCQSRYSVVLNGTSPGPLLHLREGVITWVRVYNNMQDLNLTVHWHGLTQRTAPFSDGTPQASQWPIPPMYYFDYELKPRIGDAGTYFYHSHVGFQAISANGPLIVEECGHPPYKYDDDIVLAVGDYYKKSDAMVEAGLVASPFMWSGETNAIQINGKSGSSGFNNATDPSCTPEVINVDPGKTYRMRFIGSTAISLISLGIEDHSELTIIEADGKTTKPATTDHLQIGTGQRFSLLFKAKTAEELKTAGKSAFWIRYENRARPANVSGYALLSYSGGSTQLPQQLPTTSPVTLPQKYNDWLEYTLEPFDCSVNPMPAKSTRTVVIDVQQIGKVANKSFVSFVNWAENTDIWQEPRIPTPYLVDIYKYGQAAVPNYQAALANNGWDPKTLAFPAKIGEVVDIIWQNEANVLGSYDVHPFHAHGGHYWDLGSGNGTYNATANEAKIAAQGWHPAKRDTTFLYSYATSAAANTTLGWRAWRLHVTDAGAWMIHCHILQHMIMGMQTAWVMGDAADITGSSPEPYIAGYLSYGGSAYGNATFDPLVNHHFESQGGSAGDSGCIAKSKGY